MVLSKLALFVLHASICGRAVFDMFYKKYCWAAMPDPIWTTNVPYEENKCYQPLITILGFVFLMLIDLVLNLGLLFFFLLTLYIAFI